MNKKLIEVALPLETINGGCLQEKNPFLKGHPRSIHLWWARRPLAAARAVIFAQMVDDPSSHPEKFPTIESQNKERERLFKIIEEMTKWENLHNADKIMLARQEILKSWEYVCEKHKNEENAFEKYNPKKLPMFHDPFAGGGGIPLEAERLGFNTIASDLNPVAVIINKAMIELPSMFEGKPPINPENRRLLSDQWPGTTGLQADIRYYGEWILKEANKTLCKYYPTIKDEFGQEHDVIAWIWTRAGKCPNPACGCEMPFTSTFVLSNKEGKEVWVEPVNVKQKLKFNIHYGKCPSNKETNKCGRNAIFKCPICGEITTDEYVKSIAQKGELKICLMAIVANSNNGRIYLPASEEHLQAAKTGKPIDYPEGEICKNPRWFSTPAFGMTDFYQLFTDRQLTTLCEFSNLITDAREHVLEDGGSSAYADAIAVYLACGISQLSRYSSTMCAWNKTNENVAQVFGRQAIPMVWDFAESNPLKGSLNLTSTIEWVASVIEAFGVNGKAVQADAQTQKLTYDKIVSTDPPYYDNIGYADLSDYFYIWLRKSLRKVYPELFQTILVPKTEELIATPFRHGGEKKAEQFFLNGMTYAMENLVNQVLPDYPVTIYYAFKQSDKVDKNGIASTGWATFLEAVIKAGFQITGTWPIRTERTKGLKSSVNALASSIILVCRKRANNAEIITRRIFITSLRNELKSALLNLQNSNIAPVDLAQSAIGPGMSVFSKYSQVLEADGTPMTVRSALQIINQELDLYFNEQDSELDGESRFCVDLYSQAAFNDIPFGDANTLATAKNTSVALMASHGMLYAKKGLVHLVERAELPATIKESEDNIWLLCQQLTYRMEREGIEGCAKAIVNMLGSNAERAKDLAYRLYTIAERKKWAQEAYAYNALVVAWPEIQSRAAQLKAIAPEQISLMDFLHDNN